jgi:hypothetical protein
VPLHCISKGHLSEAALSVELALHKAQGSYPIMQTSCLKHVLFSLIQNTCSLGAHNAAVRLLHQDAAWP